LTFEPRYLVSYDSRVVPTLFKSVLPLPQLSSWRARINEAYERIPRSPISQLPPPPPEGLPPGEKFVPTASSFTIGAILSGGDLNSLLSSLSENAIGLYLRQALGDQVVCNLDHSWIRRQYAPHRYPRFHAPHAWHQDGALAFDFLSYPDGNYPPDALLQMATCWIALDPCGLTAPGLELILPSMDIDNKGLLSPAAVGSVLHRDFVRSSKGGEGETAIAAGRPLSLLYPSDLTETSIRSRFPASHFYRPTLEPGDALLFPGDILHRTHVTPSMTQDRTSIELRFFPASKVPRRLEASRFLSLDPAPNL
jgi:hypothetical protein